MIDECKMARANDLERFVIKSYGIGELASYYSPGVTVGAARRKLMNWISLQPQLQLTLESMGFDHKVRCFTPAQVRAIIDALGEP